MTVIVRQQGIGDWSVKDDQTGMIIVDAQGNVLNGSDQIIAYIPTIADFVSTPVTKTAGIQEALNYAASTAIYFDNLSNGYAMPPVKLLTGIYTLNAYAVLPYFPNAKFGIPSFTILGEGSGAGAPTQINTNGYGITIGNSTGEQMSYGGFLIQGLSFNGATNGGLLQFLGNYNANSNCVLRDLYFYNANLDMTGASNLAQLNMDNVFFFNYAQFFTATSSYQISITNGTFKAGFYPNGVNQIGAVNFAEGIEIISGDPNFAFNVWELDNNSTQYGGSNGITNRVAVGSTSNMSIDAGTLVINSNNPFFGSPYNNGTLNLKMHVKHLVFQGGVMDFSLPADSLINIQEFTIDEITNNTTTDTSAANLPILSSTAGTTAGTVSMRFTEYASLHKKLVITLTGYENDTPTNQTINFPLPFNVNYTVQTALALGTSGNTLSSIDINTPNNTSVYNGIIVLDGY